MIDVRSMLWHLLNIFKNVNIISYLFLDYFHHKYEEIFIINNKLFILFSMNESSRVMNRNKLSLLIKLISLLDKSNFNWPDKHTNSYKIIDSLLKTNAVITFQHTSIWYHFLTIKTVRQAILFMIIISVKNNWTMNFVAHQA